ncbi:hypothetical protein LOD99_9357 [Oopsacas minuta]|uniref:Tetraspanin n=1 Tax=Oopsacas minuta TaxID=111878 RepID=A0AAV7JBS0_9METZ|nr:hypothetical protein LOD99_9357 [Oopsacas minuta]
MMAVIDRSMAKLTLAVLQGVMSIALFVFGIIILILSALTLVKSSSYSASFTSVITPSPYYQTGPIILIFAGLIQSLFALMGIVGGTISLSKGLYLYSLLILSVHCAALFLSGSLSLTGSMLSLRRYDSIHTETQHSIKQLLSFSPALMLITNSSKNYVVPGFLHHLQTKRGCCGWINRDDFSPAKYSFFPNSTESKYPGSCCEKQPFETCSSVEVGQREGCYDSLRNIFNRCNLYGGDSASCIHPGIFTVSSLLYASGILGMIQALISLLFFIATLIHLVSLIQFRPLSKQDVND